jgi:hypothetical protein
MRQLGKGVVAQRLSGARDKEKGMGAGSLRGRGRRRRVEGPDSAPCGEATRGGGSGDRQGTWCRVGGSRGLNRAADQ